MLAASLCGHQGFLISGIRGQWLAGDKSQLQAVDDTVHNGAIGEEVVDLLLDDGTPADIR
jgi:hypothetical protein